MFTIAGGILIAYICIVFGGIFASGIVMMAKLIWIFLAPNEDHKMAKMYRDKAAARKAAATD